MARKIQLEIAGDATSVVRAFRRASTASDHFHSRIGRSASGLIKGIAAAGTAVVGLGVAFGVQAVSKAANFEDSMARIVGLAGQSQKQVKAWSDQLLALGPALGKSPQELADALYFIASSGIPASQAISTLVASAKASSAGLGETEVVADAATSVMNAYGIANMSAAHATDILVATVREGKGEASSFAGVIGNVAAFASRLNVPFEQVGAALAAMTQLGTDPATAATQLQAFFSQVIRPSPKAVKAAKDVGFSFQALSDTLQKKGLLAALDMIKDKFKGNAGAMAQAFPNIRALRALLALTAADGGKVAGVFGRMSHSSGSLGKAFAASGKTAHHSWQRFHAAIDSLQIAFGQGLLPLVTHVANMIADKMADPKVIDRIRDIGKQFAATLVRIGKWFKAHWPEIKQGFLTAAQLAKRLYLNAMKFVHAMERIGKFVGKFGFLSGNKDLKIKALAELTKRVGPEKALQTGIKEGFLTASSAGNVYLDGKKVGEVTWNHHQRKKNRHAGQTRGRRGGDALAVP